MKFSCKFCDKLFDKGTSLGGHIPRCYKNPAFIPKPKELKYKYTPKSIITSNNEFKCECGKIFIKYTSLAAHKVLCILNKNREFTINKMRMYSHKHSEKTKKKLANIANEKIKNGTWHNSFSKARVHEYNGIKFYGKWELAYAKYLDINNIKWRRPKETFEYIFEDKKRRYTPDFYLIDSNEYVEIKGYPTNKDFAKWDHFPVNLKIISSKMLFDLGIIEHYKSSNVTYKNISWK